MVYYDSRLVLRTIGHTVDKLAESSLSLVKILSHRDGKLAAPLQTSLNPVVTTFWLDLIVGGGGTSGVKGSFFAFQVAARY